MAETTTSVIELNSGGYFNLAFDSEADLIANAERTLNGLNIDFDSMAAIGMSGHMVLPLLARHFGVPFMAIRKPGVNCHDDHGIGQYGRGAIGRRWILVDDFVCTGATVETARRQVDAAIEQHNQNTINKFDSEFVGVYCYSKRYGDMNPGHFTYPDYTRKGVAVIDVDGDDMIVDANSYRFILRKIELYTKDRYPDPTGKAIRAFKTYCYECNSTFNLDEAAAMAVYADKFLLENPGFDVYA